MLQADAPVASVLEDFTKSRFQRCKMIVDNSELLGEWEKNPSAPNADTASVVARSYRELAQPV
jgi:hypothetical protein